MAYTVGRWQGGVRFKVAFKKKFSWTTKSQNFSFFEQKKLLHYGLLCIEKSKPALTYK